MHVTNILANPTHPDNRQLVALQLGNQGFNEFSPDIKRYNVLLVI
jgi:hypothetical protein